MTRNYILRLRERLAIARKARKKGQAHEDLAKIRNLIESYYGKYPDMRRERDTELRR